LRIIGLFWLKVHIVSRHNLIVAHKLISLLQLWGVTSGFLHKFIFLNKMNQKINKFIEALASIPSSSVFCNQYSDELEVNFIRRNNLTLYFQQMVKFNPQFLLVGEAPGYRGCRLTGVPFTSEFILLKGLEPTGLFGKLRGYQKTDEFETIFKENTARMVWEILLTAPTIPLMWNAFCFHPFQATNQQSNRKPTRQELLIGREFLQQLIQMFEIKTVVAVGNTAQEALNNMQVVCEKVRHPSYGGKTHFSKGIKAIMGQ
jgi:uracil-DNA glycosylase